MRPTATVKISIRGEVYQQSAAEDGQYHALSKSMYKIYKSLNKPTSELLDYVVVIPLAEKPTLRDNKQISYTAITPLFFYFTRRK